MTTEKNLTPEQIRHNEMVKREALEQFRMANVRMDKRGGNRPVGMGDLVEIVVPGFSEDQFGNAVAYDEDGTLIRPLWALDNGFVPVLAVPMRLWVVYPRSRTFARNKYGVAIPFDIVYFKGKGLGLWNHKLSDRCEFRNAVAVRQTRTVMVAFEPNPRRKDEWHGGFVGGKHIVWKPHGNPYENSGVEIGMPIEVQASESWDRIECLPAVQTRRVKADGSVEELEVQTALVDVALKPGQIQCRASGVRLWALDALGVKRHTDEAVLDRRIAEMLATRGERLNPETDPFCLAAKAAGSTVDYRLAGVNAREVAIKNSGSILRPKAPKIGHVAILHPETGAKICDVLIEDVLGGDLSIYSSRDEVMARFNQLKRYRRRSYAEHNDDDTIVEAVKAVFKRFGVHLEVDNKIRSQVGEDATRALLERLISRGSIRFKPARSRSELVVSAYAVLGLESSDADEDSVFKRFRELYFVKKGKVEREDPAVMVLYKSPGYRSNPNQNKGYNDRRALMRTAGEHLMGADRFKTALTPPEEPKSEFDNEAEELRSSSDDE